MRTASWNQRSQNLKIKAELVRARTLLRHVKRSLNVEWVERLVSHAALQIGLAASFIENDPQRAHQHLRTAKMVLGFTSVFKDHHNPIFSTGRSQAALKITQALKSQFDKALFFMNGTAWQSVQKRPQFVNTKSGEHHPLSVRPQISPNAPAL